MGSSPTKPRQVSLAPNNYNPQTAGMNSPPRSYSDKQYEQSPIQTRNGSGNRQFDPTAVVRSISAVGTKAYAVSNLGLARSTSVRSTIAGDMSIGMNDKVYHAMTKEEREIRKLQQIYELEQSKA